MPTLAQYRAAFYRRPGFTRVPATTGVYSGTTYAGVATGTNSLRTLVSSDLADMNLVGTGTDLAATYLQGGWSYIPSVPVQRRIIERGFTANVDASDVTDQAASDVRVGYLVHGRNFAGTIAANTPFEILAPVPFQDHMGVDGAVTYLNRALSVQVRVKRLSITGVTNYDYYNLTDTYPWITRPEQLIQVYDIIRATGEDQLPLPGQSVIRFDGDDGYLVLPWAAFNSAQTFYVDVWQPRNNWIKVSGTWANSTVGLVNESDEATGELEVTASLAAYYAYCRLSEGAVGGNDSGWERWRAEFAQSLADYLSDEQVAALERSIRETYNGEFSTPSRNAWAAGGGYGRWP